MKKKYLVGVIISVFVLTCNQVFIQYWLQKKKQDAEVINIAGRQRMLSQRIDLELYKIHYGHTNTAKLKELEARWKKAHYALLNGSKELKLNAIEDPASRAILTDISPKLEAIIKTIDNGDYKDEAALVRVSDELNAFLGVMDGAVAALQESADNKLMFIVITEIVLAIISIAVIVLEVFIIYKPITANLQQQMNAVVQSEQELKDRNSKLKRIAEIQSHKLRRPLANILGLLHLIKFDDRNEFNPVYLEKLKKSAEELDETIATIVSHTKTIQEDEVEL